MKLNRSKPPVSFKFSSIEIPSPYSYIFSSGLKLHYFDIENSNVFKIEFILKNANSFNESQLGINLLISKLFLSGTSNKSASTISELLAQLGAFIDISPSFDYTSITIHCLKKNIVKTLRLINEIFNDINITDSEIGLQKKILSSNYQIQQKKNNIIASQKYRNILFGNNPYGLTPNPKNWDTIYIDDLIADFNKYWTNYELIVIGPKNKYVLAELEQNFIPSKLESIKQPNSKIKATKNPKKESIDITNSIQTSLKIGCITIDKKHNDYPALLMANYILGGYFGSRLMKNIREEKGLTYGIHSSIINLCNASYFAISSDVEMNKKELAIKEIQSELELISNTPVMSSELQIAKNHWLGSFQNDLSSPLSLNEKFKNYFLYDLPKDYYRILIQKIGELTTNDILITSKKYFNPSLMNTLTVGG